MTDNTLFQYCQKIVLFRNKNSEVLLARRRNEADFNEVYTLIGGKLENFDNNILAGLKREKNEEIGKGVKILVHPTVSYNVYYVKNNGTHMILPHYYATYLKGDIRLSDEYDDYKWVSLAELKEFEPKPSNIPEIVKWAKKYSEIIRTNELIEI